MGDLDSTRQGLSVGHAAGKPELFVGRAAGKDAAANILVMGFASTAWFGWAHQAGVFALQIPLALGMAFGVVLGVVGFVARGRIGTLAVRGVLTSRSVHEVRTRASNRIYFAALGFELVFAFGGAFTLGRLEHPEYIIAWVMLIMGLHFIPLAKLYRIPELLGAGLLCIALSLSGALSGFMGGPGPAAIAGTGAGTVLLATGVICGVRLRRAWRSTVRRTNVSTPPKAVA